MSQVKNLRAMFEVKGDDNTSPPDRGRSAGTTESGSPRPLSKIRSSFVAIEKDGRMGLRRDQSGGSSPSRRRLSNDTDAESAVGLHDKIASVAHDDNARSARKLFVDDPIPESPRDLPAEARLEPSLLEKPSAEPEEPSKTLPSQPIEQEADKPSTPISTMQGNDKPKSRSVSPAKTPRPARAPVTKPATQTKHTVTEDKKKQPPASSEKTEAKPTKNTVTKTNLKKDQTSVASSSAKVPSMTTTAPKATAAKTTKRPEALKPAVSNGTGFVKPKPKSPTRPERLPSSLLAPTASSGSKVHGSGAPAARSTLSAQSGNLQAGSDSSRPRSRMNSSLAEPTKTVRRKPSSINRPRTSIGPPPAKKENQSPATSSKPRQVDESFLTRMMRPTQASASKTTEKAPITPPRKSAPRQQATSNSRSSGGRASSSASGHRPATKLSKQPSQETNGTEDVTARTTADAPPPKMSPIVNIPEVAVHDEAAADATPNDADIETKQDASSPALVSPLEEVAVETPSTSGSDVPNHNVKPDEETAPMNATDGGELESQHDVSAAVVKDANEEHTEKLLDVEQPPATVTAPGKTNTDKPDPMMSIEHNLAQLSLHDGEVKPQDQEQSEDLEKTITEEASEEKTLNDDLPEGEISGEASAAM